MSEPRRTAAASVVITLEIEAGDSWGPECTYGQIIKQAQESALAKLNQMHEKSRWPQGIRLVKVNSVNVRLVEEK